MLHWLLARDTHDGDDDDDGDHDNDDDGDGYGDDVVNCWWWWWWWGWHNIQLQNSCLQIIAFSSKPLTSDNHPHIESSDVWEGRDISLFLYGDYNDDCDCYDDTCSQFLDRRASLPLYTFLKTTFDRHHTNIRHHYSIIETTIINTAWIVATMIPASSPSAPPSVSPSAPPNHLYHHQQHLNEDIWTVQACREELGMMVVRHFRRYNPLTRHSTWDNDDHCWIEMMMIMARWGFFCSISQRKEE